MKSHKHYSELRQRCRKEWEEIKQLEGQNRTDEEEQKLATLRHSFTLTMSADYQMSKLVPYWGLSPQPSSTYYLQKLSHDIFGVVDHREDKACFYIFNEIIGPKIQTTPPLTSPSTCDTICQYGSGGFTSLLTMLVVLTRISVLCHGRWKSFSKRFWTSSEYQS